jgi:hypothetical protein
MRSPRRKWRAGWESLTQQSWRGINELRIEMEAGSVELGEGQMFVVPKGVDHNPVAERECLLMLIERKSTLHKGNAVNERTRTLAEQLRPITDTLPPAQ